MYTVNKLNWLFAKSSQYNWGIIELQQSICFVNSHDLDLKITFAVAALHICNLLTFILYQLVTADFLLTRSTRLHVLYKNVLLKIFAKFTGNQLPQSLFYSNFLSKETTVLVISCEIVRIFSENLSHRTPLGDSFWLDCKSLIISIEGDEPLMKLSSEKFICHEL